LGTVQLCTSNRPFPTTRSREHEKLDSVFDKKPDDSSIGRNFFSGINGVVVLLVLVLMLVLVIDLLVCGGIVSLGYGRVVVLLVFVLVLVLMIGIFC
jgi:hypothetical protein